MRETHSGQTFQTIEGKYIFLVIPIFMIIRELIDEDDFPGNNVHQIVVGTGGGGFHRDSTL